MVDRTLLVNVAIGGLLSVIATVLIRSLSSTVAVLRPAVVLAPAVGGIVAGYLQKDGRRASLKVGALAGLLAAVLLLASVVPLFLFTVVYSPPSRQEAIVIFGKLGAGMGFVIGINTAAGLFGWFFHELSTG